ncbi:MAG: LapA family protein [Chloroflexota bacterium]
MKVVFLPLILLVSVSMVVFGIQNPQTVNVYFLGIASGEVSLSLVIIISALAGATLVGLFSGWDRIRNALDKRQTHKQLTLAKKQHQEALQQISTQSEEITKLHERLLELEEQHTTSAEKATKGAVPSTKVSPADKRTQ